MKKIITLIFVTISLYGFAQDYHWSTANLNRSLLNPAENALDSGINTSVVYRNQWKSVMTPFSTVGINVNASIPKNLGVGLTLIDDKAGSLGWHKTNAMLNLNYAFNLGKTKLKVGAGFGIDQTVIDFEKAIFPDQINPDLSIGLTAEQFPGKNVNRFDNTAGLNALIPIGKKVLHVGVSYNHFLAQNDVSFFNTYVDAANLLNTFVSMPLNVNANWVAKPFVTYQNQATFNSASFGSTFHYQIDQKEFFTGFNYRFRDALIGQAGVNMNNIRLGISYDYTISSLRANAGGTGAIELFASYHINKKKTTPVIDEKKETMVLKEVPSSIDLLVTITDGKSNNTIDAFYFEIEDLANNKIVKSDTGRALHLFSELEFCTEYKLSISKKGFLNYSKTFKTSCDEKPNVHIIDTAYLEPLEVNKNYTLNNIYYEYDETALTEKSKTELKNLFSILNENPTMTIELSSHTDNKGSEEYNQKLSEVRAQSCVNYLIELGVNKARLKARGYGESQPIAPNENIDGSDNPLGREKNRRTEFKIIAL